MSQSVVLITGALTGIGRATALAFAKQGAHLVVSSRHDDAGRPSRGSYATSVSKPSSFGRMSATGMRCAASSSRRDGTPEEIADAILFAASERAAFITGQIIRVNGGKTAS